VSSSGEIAVKVGNLSVSEKEGLVTRPRLWISQKSGNLILLLRQLLKLECDVFKASSSVSDGMVAFGEVTDVDWQKAVGFNWGIWVLPCGTRVVLPSCLLVKSLNVVLLLLDGLGDLLDVFSLCLVVLQEVSHVEFFGSLQDLVLE